VCVLRVERLPGFQKFEVDTAEDLVVRFGVVRL
jgi:hypothetical protein